nr:MAG: ORF1 [TTV-like mini virus]
MPPYYRKRYYKRNYWNWRHRRNAFRRRRFRKTFFRKPRHRRVRKFRFYKRNQKKLKKLRLQQFQPSYIRKCSIKGFLLLFEAGHGFFGNNFCCYKESYTPHNQPSGGGWSIQQLGLGNLFTQNQYFMNYWSHTNNGLNLVRYNGVKITLYRQPHIDYVFTYFNEQPKNSGKYWYPTFHPMKMLTYKNRIIVPSLDTQPNKRKIFKKIYLRPPKLLKNQWYFAQHLSSYPLINFAATAVSLSHMFLSSKSNNNNCSVITLNTDFFKKSAFQYAASETGYIPQDNVYIYGLNNGTIDLKNEKLINITYLGGMQREKGVPIGTQNLNQYKASQWGNVFYYEYFNHIRTSFISTSSPKALLKQTRNTTDTIGETEFAKIKFHPYHYTERYNPYKDKGDGNVAYWLSVSDATKNNWDPPKDEDLIIRGYPFWLMLWGWEDYTKKCGKIRDFDNNAILVLQSRYISGTHKYYVPLSDSFVQGRAPYDNDPEDITPNDNAHWFPKWKFQKEAIDNILMTGPGVVKAENQQSIQAFIKYNFFFKWGGNSSTLETISDPNSQPITPSPPGLYLQNEITDPKTPIENMLYKWDIRRHLLTQAATTRIKEIQTHDECLFTDGAETSTDYPIQAAPQEEKTPQTEKETLLLQLQQLEQFNNQLQQRLLKLQQLTEL